MRITRIEALELLLHLETSPFFWTRCELEGQVLWAHTQDPEYVLSLQEAGEAFDGMDAVILEDPSERGAQHLRRVLQHWTRFATREATAKLLREANVEDALAESLASTLQDLPVEVDAEGVWPDSLAPHREARSAEALFPLREGGWLRLELRSDELLGTLSVPNRATGGYGSLLQGFLRPVSGRLRDDVIPVLEEEEHVDLRTGAVTLYDELSEPDVRSEIEE